MGRVSTYWQVDQLGEERMKEAVTRERRADLIDIRNEDHEDLKIDWMEVGWRTKVEVIQGNLRSLFSL